MQTQIIEVKDGYSKERIVVALTNNGYAVRVGETVNNSVLPRHEYWVIEYWK